MSQCKYYEICGRDVEDNSAEGLCILHSTDPAKDGDAFAKALTAHRERNVDDFSWFVFPGRADFSKVTFSEGATFYGATFTKEANFRGAAFSDGANFGDVTFSGGAEFREAMFNAEMAPYAANFYGATFRRRANFSGAMFSADANFSRVTFNGWVYFLDTTFSEEAIPKFHSTTFGEEADFNGATFSGGAEFIEATFTKLARFGGTTFSEEATFSQATFSGGAYFLGAAFSRGASFSNVTFSEKTYFSRSTFDGWVSFSSTIWSSTKFIKEAYFCGTTFTTKVDFDGVTFSEGADFRGTTFSKRASFREATFSGKTRFERGAKAGYICAGLEIDFRQVTINPPDAVTFLGTNLTKCRFQDTDLRKVLLDGVTWPRKKGRWIVYDEIAPVEAADELEEEGRGRRPWSRIERLYRDLKQNYEDRRDYERAGDFHYGEKEMRRRNPDTTWGLWVFLMLYWLFSGYGERYLLPLLWAGFLFILSTIGYMWWGLRLKDGSSSLAWTYPWVNPWDWLRAAHYSFQVMTLLKPDDWVPLRYAKGINTFQTLLGPTFLGLFALALRQRLKR